MNHNSYSFSKEILLNYVKIKANNSNFADTDIIYSYGLIILKPEFELVVNIF